MKKTRFTDEQMVTILREADRRPVPEVAKRHGVSAQTIYSWRKHFGTRPSRRRAIGNLTELSRWTPGLTVVDQWARGSNVVIARGLHTDALTGSEQALLKGCTTWFRPLARSSV